MATGAARRFRCWVLGFGFMGVSVLIAAPNLGASTMATQLTPGIARHSISQGATFFDRTLGFDYSMGPVVLAGQPDGTGVHWVDDILQLFVFHPDGSTAFHSFDYSRGCQGFISEVSPVELTHLFEPGRNRVQIVLLDRCGVVAGSSPLYLVTFNEPPVANPQAFSVDEDTSVSITLTGTDPEGDGLAFTIVSGPTHGSLSGTPPTVVYSPAPDYAGLDSFEFRVDDGQGNSDMATVSIDVRPVQDPPVAVDDVASTPEDTPLSLATATILANDSDADGDPLTVTAVVAGPSTHGAVSLAGSEITYTPAPDFHGVATFTYEMTDGVSVATATVTVTVTPVNDDPVCAAVVSDKQVLWPPSHDMHTISLSGATDVDGDSVVLAVNGVTQDEPVNGLGDGDTAPDAAVGQSPNQVQLRAERTGTGDGRVYRVSFAATDGNGGSCSGTVKVSVPKARSGPNAVAVESPMVVDSFGA